MILLLPMASGAADHKDRIPVRRVPDTWATAPTDDSVYFERGSLAIDGTALALIQRHAAKLDAVPALQVTLIAHTEDLGSSSIELAQGQELLDVVRRRLKELRIAPDRTHTENHGAENRSVERCTDDDCARKSRRVDFVFQP